MTLSELLTSLAPCPVSDTYLEAIGSEVGVEMDLETDEVSERVCNRLKARLYLFLATMPNISEGGVSISFTATEKNMFLALAKRYAALAGETGLVTGPAYGYKGESV